MAKGTRKSGRKAARKAGRKASRKQMGGNKMYGGKGTRKGGKGRKGGLRLVQRVWSPFNHLLRATGESAQRVGSTAGRIVKETVGLPAGVGRTFAKHSNMAVRNVFRGGRSRKVRRSGRRHSGRR
jgi:hypothetical protein